MPAPPELSVASLTRIAIEVGVNVQPGQPLEIIAPVAARDFVHRLAKAAYQRGSGVVTCVYEDPVLIRMALTDMAVSRANPAPSAVHRRRPSEMALLRLVGPEPSLLDGMLLERILTLHSLMRCDAEQDGPHTCTMPFVTQDWATAVRPELPADHAIATLWNDIFVMCGADLSNTADTLSKRLDRATRVRDWLNDLRAVELHLVGDKTDLRVRPLAGAQWSTSLRTTALGDQYLAELPAGAIRIPLDPLATHGFLAITKPLRIAGVTVCDLVLKFEAGRVAQCDARSGGKEFERLLATDDGAARLGAIGLVESIGARPIPCGGFLAPALDRACRPHVVLGRAHEAIDLSGAACGGNCSALSLDVAFGTERIEIRGVLPDNATRVLLHRQRFCL